MGFREQRLKIFRVGVRVLGTHILWALGWDQGGTGNRRGGCKFAIVNVTEEGGGEGGTFAILNCYKPI